MPSRLLALRDLLDPIGAQERTKQKRKLAEILHSEALGLINPNPFVEVLLETGFTVRMPFVVWPFVIIDCGAGTRLRQRAAFLGATLERIATKALSSWSFLNISCVPLRNGRVAVYISHAKVLKKRGRPKKDHIRLQVRQLRSQRKSWSEVQRIMNKTIGQSLTVTAYRNLVSRK